MRGLVFLVPFAAAGIFYAILAFGLWFESSAAVLSFLGGAF
jgi:hypothetical protein